MIFYYMLCGWNAWKSKARIYHDGDVGPVMMMMVWIWRGGRNSRGAMDGLG